MHFAVNFSPIAFYNTIWSFIILLKKYNTYYYEWLAYSTVYLMKNKMISEKIKKINNTIHMFPTSMMGLEYLVDLGKKSTEGFPEEYKIE